MSTVQPENYKGRRIGHLPEILKIFEDNAEVLAITRDFCETVETLKGDVARSVSWYKKSPTNQFWRRSLVKNLFAWFEGQVFVMKRQALAKNKHFDIGFSDAELALLQEGKHALNQKGEACTSKSNFQKFIPNLQFAFKCFARAHGMTYQFDKSIIPELEKAEKVRNRLTHPKSAKDLNVLDEEMGLISQALTWHLKEIKEILKGSSRQSPIPIRMPGLKGVNRLLLTLPVLMYWRDGTAYEFPTRRAAKSFANAKGGSNAPKDSLIYQAEEFEGDETLGS